MTPHRHCLDALTEAMALPIVAVPDHDHCPCGCGAHMGCFIYDEEPSPPRWRKQGRIQDYGRRAG